MWGVMGSIMVAPYCARCPGGWAGERDWQPSALLLILICKVAGLGSPAELPHSGDVAVQGADPMSSDFPEARALCLPSSLVP